MRVALLVAGLPPVYNGGAEISAARIAACAIRSGHDVHVIALGKRPPGQPGGVHIHYIPTTEVRYVRGLACAPALLKAIHDINPDIVHVQSAYMAPGAILANRLLGKPYLFYERGGVDMRLGIYLIVYPLTLKYARRVIAQTEKQRTSLMAYGRTDVEVIPNGVDTSSFGKVSRIVARLELGLPLDRKIALLVGRCRPEKNVRGFVQAAALLPEYLFLAVGDGPQLGLLKKTAGSNVQFAGSVDSQNTHLYYSAADVLVNTSLSEGFPLTILEGMASGLPIVAPDVCGIPEIIQDGVNGILTPSGDFRATAAAVNHILCDSARAASMSDCNRRKAREYSWEKVVDQLYGKEGQ